MNETAIEIIPAHNIFLLSRLLALTNNTHGLCEVEVELKSGSEAAAIALARELADNYGLKEENKSKFRRAMDLAQGE